jgi:hypothetical protein
VNQTHTLADWLAMVCIAVSGYAALSAPWFVFVDADLADFDPRPAARRTHQGLVYAGHDLTRAVMSVRHELVPVAAAVRHAVYVGRETARDLAALLILLTSRPKGALA